MKSSAPTELGHGAGPMLEPVRLLTGTSTPFEKQLLASAAIDQMPAASLERLASALNVPGSFLPAAGAPPMRPLPAGGLPAAGLGPAAALGKGASLTGFGVLGVVAIAASSWLVRSVPERAASPEPAALVAVVTSAAPASNVASGTANSVVQPTVASATPAVLAAAPAATAAAKPRARRAAEARPRSSAQERPQPQPQGGLRAELAALEAVQSASRAGNAEVAAQSLSEYSRRFPQGALALEAQLLGVDIALARGERELARARARELLAKPGGARYRERLDALLTGASPAMLPPAMSPPAMSPRSESGPSPHGTSEVIR